MGGLMARVGIDGDSKRIDGEAIRIRGPFVDGLPASHPLTIP
jgi:hypothetical protein